MKKYNFNEFEKYTKKDKIYLIFYLSILVLSLAMLGLNIAVICINQNDYASIAFITIFSVVTLFVLFLLTKYLMIPKDVLSINYDEETITINKRIGKPTIIKLKDINEIKTLDKRLFFNVINLGSLYFITADKTYRAKYLISPKYLAITLNIYVATAKEEKNGTN